MDVSDKKCTATRADDRSPLSNDDDCLTISALEFPGLVAEEIEYSRSSLNEKLSPECICGGAVSICGSAGSDCDL